MKSISLIVAMSENNVIGHNNKLLWHLPNDLKRFKQITMGKPIVMGRKTYESIGKPLPGRQNIVLTNARYLQVPGCDVVHSVNEALDKTGNAEEIMVIGGAEIYKLFYPLATKMYVTFVHTTLEGNVNFISWNREDWDEVLVESHNNDEKHIHDYTFVDFVRVKEAEKSF
jgi:dihydrofolate reductase